VERLAVGVVLGYLFAVIKPVVSDWITDHRRACAMREAARKQFDATRQLMPDLIHDLRQELKKTPLVRDIVVVRNREYYVDRSTTAFIYFEDDYPNVRQQALMLANAGYQQIVDSAGSSPKYRMTETFVTFVSA
jgi:hypothetical protein